jgi:hypothetical protein
LTLNDIRVPEKDQLRRGKPEGANWCGRISEKALGAVLLSSLRQSFFCMFPTVFGRASSLAS